MDGAQAFVQRLLDDGYDVVIFSHRAVDPEGVRHIAEWLEEHEFPEVKQITGIKPAAKVYVDDRAYRFEGDFDAVVRFMGSDAALPWYEGEE